MKDPIINFDLPKHRSSIIKVIGVGGGGGNAVNNMYITGIRDVDFVVCNTDLQVLNASPVPIKLQLGPTVSEGRGAGHKPDRGRQAALESIDQIVKLLSENTKMVFITAGLGGGTGTGAAPIIAEEAKKLGILTVAIVTTPFKWEGTHKMNNALEGIQQLKKHVDALIVIDNEKIKEYFGDKSGLGGFAMADNVLTIAAKSIAEIITVPGYINRDFEDVRTVMSNSGVALMGAAEASGNDRAMKVVTEALKSPLLNNNNIYGAKNILFNITSGKENDIKIDEIGEIAEYLQNAAGNNAEILWGLTYDENLGDKIHLTVIATGFPENIIPELEIQKAREVIKVPVGSNNPTEPKSTDIPDEKMSMASTTKIPTPKIKPVEAKPQPGTSAPRTLERSTENPPLIDSPTYLIDKNLLEEMESQPAILRRGGKAGIENLMTSETNTDSATISRYRISLDDSDDDIFRQASPYLDKNVD